MKSFPSSLADQETGISPTSTQVLSPPVHRGSVSSSSVCKDPIHKALTSQITCNNIEKRSHDNHIYFCTYFAT